MSIINSEMQLSYISHKNMTQEHISAIGMMTEFFNCFKKIFPERSLPHTIPNVNKDPRKTFVFRCCLCAVRQTEKDKINYHEWVVAQLKVLKAVQTEIVITSQCLCGERAQKRWFVWLKFKRKQIDHHEPAKPDENITKILDQIKQTHKFFISKRKTIKELTEDGSVKWLLSLGKISPYYVILHPDIQKIIKERGWKFIDENLEKIKVPNLVEKSFLEIIK